MQFPPLPVLFSTSEQLQRLLLEAFLSQLQQQLVMPISLFPIDQQEHLQPVFLIELVQLRQLQPLFLT